MLQALLNGKAGTLPFGARPGESLRKVYRGSEDLLTSTVFERLAYMDGLALWELLRSTFRPEILPLRKIVDLEQVEFWPSWGKAAEILGQTVEPDVVLRFSVGDPSRSVTVIVEAKLGGWQNHQQWAREWIAHQEEYAGGDAPDDCYFLAIGGLPSQAERTVSSFHSSIAEANGPSFPAAAADWKDLARTIHDSLADGRGPLRLLSDIQDALALHGYRHMQGLRELAKLSSHRSGTFDKSMAGIRINLGGVRPATTIAQRQSQTEPPNLPARWLANTSGFRPILTSPSKLGRLRQAHDR